eukprot:365605-Chlamydomonas_euryale.AAC.2
MSNAGVPGRSMLLILSEGYSSRRPLPFLRCSQSPLFQAPSLPLDAADKSRATTGRVRALWPSAAAGAGWAAGR